MKILAINGSPRGKNSCTNSMLKPLLAGMQDKGATIETIHLVEKNIQHCNGCFGCWFKTPGKCLINDDMRNILEKMVTVDMVIYGTPLYVYSMSGLMKNFLDRIIPLAQPFMEETHSGSNLTQHPSRYNLQDQGVLLVSPCGFPEFEHFSALVENFKKLARSRYLGEILRPTASLMFEDDMQEIANNYIKALYQTGQELITSKKISAETQKELTKLWVTPTEYRGYLNKIFAQKLSNKGTSEIHP